MYNSALPRAMDRMFIKPTDARSFSEHSIVIRRLQPRIFNGIHTGTCSLAFI
jgi:hypothetical protein